MKGCFRNVFALIGCGTVLLAALVIAWQYRAQLIGAYESVFSEAPADSVEVAARAVGTPSARALASAQRKERAMARANGPALVTLSAEEMASLVAHRLDPVARRALDSIEVELGDDRFTLEAMMRTDLMSRELLGPFADVLESAQPVRLSGPGELLEPGRLGWEVDEFVIRAFPFPASAIPKLVNRLTGGSDGAFVIRIPKTVGDVRIRPSGVTFYRQVR